MSIDPALWRQVAPLFDRLAPMDNDDRRAWLDGAVLDPNQRAALEALLAAHDAPLEELIESSAPHLLGLGHDPVEADWSGRRLGPWRVCERIAEGGMSSIYRGERDDGQFRKQVAIKVLRTAGLGTDPKHLAEEIRILARLEHPGIARLIDSGTVEDGAHWLVMEHVEGTPVDRAFADRSPDLPTRVRQVIAITDALEYAHQRQVVHCDIKPGNVLVRPDGRICVVDFGIAGLVRTGAAREAVGRVYCSPGYCAPERMRGAPPDTGHDIYSTGALLARLLCGPSDPDAANQTPDRGTGTAADGAWTTGSAARPTTPLERLAQVESSLPRDLRAIVARATAVDPGRRYGSMGALRADLEAWLERRPVAARGGGHGYVARRWLQRHALAAGLAGLAAVALVGGTAAALYQAREARAEADRAMAVRDLLVDVFSAADPTREDGDDPPASELLRRGIETIDGRLTDQPELQAELLQLIGYTQYERGLFRDAEATLTRALALFEPQPPQRAQALALADLGMVRYELGDLDRAIAQLAEARALALQLDLPWADQALITTRLADMHTIAGDGDVALALLRPLLADPNADQSGHWPLVYTLRTLGAAHEVDGDAEQAVRLLRQALAVQRDHDPNDVFVAKIDNELGIALLNLGQVDEAAAVFSDSLELMRRVYGPTHPQTLTTRFNLASVQLAAGDHAAAEQAFADNIEALRMMFGDSDHPDLAVGLSLLAWSRLQRGAAGEAVRPAREAMAINDRLEGKASHQPWITSLHALIELRLGRSPDPDRLGRYAADCHALDDITALNRWICLARAWQAVEGTDSCPPGLPPAASEETLTSLPADWKGIYRGLLERCRPEALRESRLPPPPAWLTARDSQDGSSIRH